ncbi:MAG TPA: type II toxin-antitoxin system HicB family antitoxin [Candidatus Nanoarchaeia archaeon]|nr:type II toxin-antitoxin system HicB family antitoxin [Candidatus Nanoarchaeia archaeon]
MAKQITVTVLVKQEDTGYSVVCPELNVASQGETFEESIANIKEAVELYIESAEELGIMDEVLEQLGISKKDFKQGKIVPKIVTASVPVEITI